ncbi:MAG: indole-3-glycerol phosphate synthase TrpC [SAR202 cluster bacterium]|nr:indole-3-glycerol phosphate synthase [Chloroflexota bacterium]MQG38662.1 indole-3-glycerol phosphate synthase TrpC [SAR202 cluster bacterium]|tara:strand:+ start:51 stop:827 length:777 start_codon:yes stop_codon:yes gene_type:complete
MLDEIVEQKKLELIDTKSNISQSKLMELIGARKNPPLNFAGSLMGDRIRVIAEIKKKSPSKGHFNSVYSHKELALKYADNGAAAISVLTNKKYFDGSIADMSDVIELVSSYRIPVLRKEFIVDQYQVYESRAFGADALLLIVSVLGMKKLVEMLELASSLWMQCLVEVHTEEELKIALDAGAEILGINNRDLKTMTTSIQTTEKLAPLIPNGKIIVSESGINSYSDIERVKNVGVNAVLVGESLVTASDPGLALSGLA